MIDTSNGQVRQLQQSLTRASKEVKTTWYEVAEVNQQVAAIQTAIISLLDVMLESAVLMLHCIYILY